MARPPAVPVSRCADQKGTAPPAALLVIIYTGASFVDPPDRALAADHRRDQTTGY